MKLYQSIIVLSAATLLFLGCSSKEKERIEAEEKARREEAAGNKAITDMNRRIFGKKDQPAPSTPPASDPASSAPAAKTDEKSAAKP